MSAVRCPVGNEPVEYKRYRMRYHRHAAWAVFFDALGIDWLYEQQGYGYRGRYMPDFWLPTFCGGLHVEIGCVQSFDKEHFSCAKDFAGTHKTSVWLAHGLPDWCVSKVFQWNQPCGQTLIMAGVPNAGEARLQDRMDWFPTYAKNDGTLDMHNPEVREKLGSVFINAVLASMYSDFVKDIPVNLVTTASGNYEFDDDDESGF